MAVETVTVDNNVVRGDTFRFTVLTAHLIRMEYSATGEFVDAPTQLVVCRDFDVPRFSVNENADWLEIITDSLHLRYNKQPFSADGLSIRMRNRVQSAHATTWHFGDPQSSELAGGNLLGTARTLDFVDGKCDLEPGLLSTYGYAVVDDSHSMLITADGWVAPRDSIGSDLYFFGYGLDFQAALRDYFKLTGASPLLPKWALGNWWSRYHKYSQQEYVDLMDDFAARRIPFSVAVIDMDWHLVDIDPEIGSGWTGYTWNTELFPNPEQFLTELHQRGLKTSLNVHPADGVRRHEAAYEAVARDLDVDPATGNDVVFDIGSRRFVDSYFKRLHHPLEEQGVDFWWIDWQSGSLSGTSGLDPLWMLNYLHYRDSARKGERPLTFSRYAGLGSHRFPVGFSGDTVISWESLAFQPYFTATAANVGYFWWSHDIGGHFMGYRDDELATRWFQLGVFSPINRLHSSNSAFNSKEPWRYGVREAAIMERFLRLRHQLVPYLYTAMWEAHTNGIGPVRPMYHDYPTEPEAYRVPNQYLFGPDMIVAPITSPADQSTYQGRVDVWLPNGTWYDFFSGRKYDGGRRIAIFRPLEEMPVFVRDGAIIPLAADFMAPLENATKSLVFRVFGDAAGTARIVEDDGSPAAEPATIKVTREPIGNGHDMRFVIQGSPNLIEPHTREITIELVGMGATSARLRTRQSRWYFGYLAMRQVPQESSRTMVARQPNQPQSKSPANRLAMAMTCDLLFKVRRT